MGNQDKTPDPLPFQLTEYDFAGQYSECWWREFLAPKGGEREERAVGDKREWMAAFHRQPQSAWLGIPRPVLRPILLPSDATYRLLVYGAALESRS